ncbi:MAG: dihydropteroate synthase [Methylococcus sp.]
MLVKNRLSVRLQSEKPIIMGILNATPDSFSDGGKFLVTRDAVEAGISMFLDGADIVDIGGESTRPGASPVTAEEQLARVLPVITALKADSRFPEAGMISIDTCSARVADESIAAGAEMVNDVTAGTGDPGMLPLLAEAGVPVVLMHMQGTPETMQADPHYHDVVSEVIDYLLNRIEAAKTAGVPDGNIIIDPGIGFGKRREHNLSLLANLDRIVDLGYPVLLGCSRKRFMGAICREQQPRELLGATVATTALGVRQGVRLFRVHDVKANRQAADVAQAIAAGR